MADTCAVITAQPAPANQLLVDIALRQGYQQVLKPVDRTTVMYDSSVISSYTQVALSPNQTFPTNAVFSSSFLYITTDNPVQVQYTLHGQTTQVTMMVTRILVLDASVDQVQISNPMPTTTTANVRIVYDGSASFTPTSPTILAMITEWALTQAFQLASATRDANGALQTANIVWPDGATGVYTTDTASTAFLGLVDAWHATYVVNGVTKTITQPLVTRDSGGNIVQQPAITIV